MSPASRPLSARLLYALGSLSLGLALASLAAAAQAAELAVDAAWARATVSGQRTSAAFMRLSSSEKLDVVSASTPVAGVAALHEMAMQNGVMTMRPVPAFHLEPGRPTVLSPDGMHIMLFDLKAPLSAGQHFALKLGLKAADGSVSEKTVDVEVRPLNAKAPGS